MTNHAELSRDLALALGWKWVEIHDCGIVMVSESDDPCEPCAAFDYRMPDVAMPLLKWLMVEHKYTVDYGVHFAVWRHGALACLADTLEEVIARAVISVHAK